MTHNRLEPLSIKRIILRYILPWGITCIALYLAFRSVDWSLLFSELKSVQLGYLALAVGLTVLSYLFRARRWQHLFPESPITLLISAKVLFLGFFMNNILPARAGEFVRAHVGSRVSGLKRTLVLATVATERLADGLALSLLFLIFALGLSNAALSRSLLFVVALFGGVTLAVGLALFFRSGVVKFLQRIHDRVNHRSSAYIFDRVQVFLDGLAPLYSRGKLPFLILWSIVIWMIELFVYLSIAFAYDQPMSLPVAVLFLVAVNFSSLIPAAPGGIGVIEAVASGVLISQGIDQHVALAMVITQHFIQYLVVGIPGVVMLFTWRRMVQTSDDIRDDSE